MTDEERSGEGPPEDPRSSKGDVADVERAGRGYDETYGREAGERFREGGYSHVYGGPRAVDWRRALRAYVAGHDRGWEADRKYARAAEEGGRPSGPAGGDPAAGRPPGSGGGAAAGASTAPTREGGRYGVAVPDRDRLDFHRSASTWRDRLPRSPRMPRHADRTLDGQRGKGTQA